MEIRVGDGIAYMKTLGNEVDIVLVDSTDQQGQVKAFSQKSFISQEKALKPDGVMAAQSESPWLEKEFLLKIKNNIAAGFENTDLFTLALFQLIQWGLVVDNCLTRA